MPITRAQIERALDDIIAHEEGFRFQSLGVILATQKCGKLVAHEKKADLGLDAYAPGIEFADHSGRGAACSLTATLSKVRKDIKEAQKEFKDLGVLYFVTPRHVGEKRKRKEQQWIQRVERDSGITLIVMSREHVITALLSPENAVLCANHLHIESATAPALEQTLELTRQAIADVNASWKTRVPDNGRRAPSEPEVTAFLAGLNETFPFVDHHNELSLLKYLVTLHYAGELPRGGVFAVVEEFRVKYLDKPDRDHRTGPVGWGNSAERGLFRRLEKYLDEANSNPEFPISIQLTGKPLSVVIRWKPADDTGEDPSDVPALANFGTKTTDAFLRGLSVTWASWVKAFLIRCLGTHASPSPFGGREKELNDLDRWLDSESAPRYAVIEAPAGSGKSSILAHWIEGLASRDIAYGLVYLPISARWEVGTNSETAVLEAMASRLAFLFGEPAPSVSDVPSLKELVWSYLNHPTNSHLIVVIDGLDETSGWRPRQDFLPPSDRLHLRILVAARQFDEGFTWPERLGWDTPGLVHRVQLNRLDSVGIVEILRNMGDPLAILAGRVEVVEALFAKSEGDPLVVGLYVEELRKRADEPEGFDVEELRGIVPGLRGFFQWWRRDQKSLWGTDRFAEDVQVRTLIGLCSLAEGPLSVEDLRGLAPDVFASRRDVERAADELRRFLIVMGQGRARQRYVLQHDRLASFVCEELLETHEVDCYTLMFPAYCKRVVAELVSSKRTEVSDYVVRSCRRHLDASNAAMLDYLPMVSAEWCREWERVDGTVSGYVADMDGIWRRCLAPAEINIGLRALLFRACINSRESLVDGEGLSDPRLLFWLCLKEGLINQATGEAIARRQRPRNAFRFLLAIVDVFKAASERLLPEALALARHLDPESIAEVAVRLDSGSRQAALDEAVASAWRITKADEQFAAFSRWSALAGVAVHLTGKAREKAILDVLDGVEQMDHNSSWPNQVLWKVIELLRTEDLELLNRAVAVAMAIQMDSSEVVFGLRSVIPLAEKLRGPIRNVVLDKAEQLARKSDDPDTKARLLSDVAALLPSPDRNRILEEAWNLAGEHGSPSTFASIVTKFGIAPKQKLDDAILSAYNCEDPHEATLALTQLSTSLSGEDRGRLLKDSLLAVRSIPDDGNRSLALSSVVAALTPSDENLLSSVGQIARQLRKKEDRVSLLSDIATQSGPSQRAPALREALRAAEQIDDASVCANVLGLLATRLDGPERAEIFQLAFGIATELPDYGDRVRSVSAVAIRLAPSDTELLSLAFEAIRWQLGANSEPENGPWESIRGLSAIAQSLDGSTRELWLKEASSTARKIRPGWGRAAALTDVAAASPIEERQSLLLEALAASASEIGNERVTVLGRIVRLAGASFENVVEQAQLLAVTPPASEAAEDNSDVLLLTACLAEVAVNTEGSKREEVLAQARELMRLLPQNDETAEWLAFLVGRISDQDHEATFGEAYAAATNGPSICWRACEILVHQLGSAKPDFVLHMLDLVQTRAPSYYNYHYVATCAEVAEHLDPTTHPGFFRSLLDWASGPVVLPADRLRLFEAMAPKLPIRMFSDLADKLRFIAPYAQKPNSQSFTQIEFSKFLALAVCRWDELCAYGTKSPHEQLLSWLGPISNCSRPDLLGSVVVLLPLLETVGGKSALTQLARDINECRLCYQ